MVMKQSLSLNRLGKASIFIGIAFIIPVIILLFLQWFNSAFVLYLKMLLPGNISALL